MRATREFSDFSHYTLINTIHKEERKSLIPTFHALKNVENSGNGQYLQKHLSNKKFLKMSLAKKQPSIVYWLPNEKARGYSLYLNITNRCSNNCYFCFRKFKNGVREFNLKLRKEPSSGEVIKELQTVINRKNWSEVVFCGFGEPLERLDCILEVTKWIKKYSGKVVRVDTNGQGYLLNKGREVVRELKDAGVDKVSISLNAHNKATYNQICKPEFENAFENVLEFIEKAKKKGLDTEITAVTISEVDISKVRKIAERTGVGFRVREYIPCFW